MAPQRITQYSMRTLLLSFLVGVVGVAGWAPMAWWPLVLLSYAVLAVFVMKSHSVKQAANIGLVFGIALHVVGHGWIYTGLHSTVGMAVIPAMLSSAGFLLYLALFTAVPCLVWRWIYNPTAPHFSKLSATALLASLLTVGEWGRSLFLNGFTSLSLGYALIDTWLAGYAPIFGTYGLSLIGFGGSSAIGCFLQSRVTKKSVAGLSAGVALVFGSGYGLSHLHWVSAAGGPLSYRLLQANISQQHKFDPRFASEQIQHYVAAIEKQPADLIVTPETAFPLYLNELPGDAMVRLQAFSQASHSHLLLGIATRAANSDGYNSMVHIAPDAQELTQYNKVHLMPFGEFSPAGFAWFTSSLSISLKDLSAGSPDQPPFTIASQKIGSIICDEDLTGDDVRRWLPEVTLLINPSNLAWFEGRLAIAQRTQIVRMRALESGRPILRVANTGLTAHIDDQGQIVNQIAVEHEGVLVGHLQPMQGMTPFARWGDWPVIILLVLIVIRAGVRFRPLRQLASA